jgi:hypothetical protein
MTAHRESSDDVARIWLVVRPCLVKVRSVPARCPVAAHDVVQLPVVKADGTAKRCIPARTQLT